MAHPRSSRARQAEPTGAPARPAQPSIFDLAVRSRGIGVEMERLQPIGRARSVDEDTALGLLYDQDQALGDVALTMQAVDLGDVAAQLVFAFGALDFLENDPDDRRFRDLWLRQLRQAILSAFPVVADAAGVDPDSIGGGHMVDFRDRQFAGLVAMDRSPQPPGVAPTVLVDPKRRKPSGANPRRRERTRGQADRVTA